MGKERLSVCGCQSFLSFEINSCDLLIPVGYDTQLPGGWAIGSYDDPRDIDAGGTEFGQ